MAGIVTWRRPVGCEECGLIALESGFEGYLDLIPGTRVFCPHCSLNGFGTEVPSAHVPFEWYKAIITGEDGVDRFELRKRYTTADSRAAIVTTYNEHALTVRDFKRPTFLPLLQKEGR